MLPNLVAILGRAILLSLLAGGIAWYATRGNVLATSGAILAVWVAVEGAVFVDYLRQRGRNATPNLGHVRALASVATVVALAVTVLLLLWPR